MPSDLAPGVKNWHLKLRWVRIRVKKDLVISLVNRLNKVWGIVTMSTKYLLLMQSTTLLDFKVAL